MLLLGNGTLLTLGQAPRVIAGGALLMEGDTITRVGETGELKTAYPRARYIDCRGKLTMPGFTCAHAHTYGAFARGMGLKGDPPAGFLQVLERLWWRLDRALTPEDIYHSALVALIGCVKNGTTALLDHHASPGAIAGSLGQIARAARKIGIRVNLCYEVTDRDGEQKAAEGLEENAAFITQCRQDSSPLITASLGMHASFTIGPKTMERCARVAHDLGAGVHIHAAESRDDAADCREKYGLGVIERLARYGLLGEKTLVAHCVHIGEDEMDLLAASGTNVAHNPQSNMNNAVGCAPVRRMLDRGVLVGLGSDGMSGGMVAEMKAAHLLHRFAQGDTRAGWAEIPQMQFANNARIMANFFPLRLGELAPGAAADVIVVDYDPPTPLTAENFYGHLLFGAAGQAVDTTVVAGKILMRHRVLTMVDEKETNAVARELAAKLWERI